MMPSLPTRPDLFRGRAFALAALTAFAGPALGAAQRTFVASNGSDAKPDLLARGAVPQVQRGHCADHPRRRGRDSRHRRLRADDDHQIDQDHRAFGRLWRNQRDRWRQSDDGSSSTPARATSSRYAVSTSPAYRRRPPSPCTASTSRAPASFTSRRRRSRTSRRTQASASACRRDRKPCCSSSTASCASAQPASASTAPRRINPPIATIDNTHIERGTNTQSGLSIVGVRTSGNYLVNIRKSLLTTGLIGVVASQATISDTPTVTIFDSQITLMATAAIQTGPARARHHRPAARQRPALDDQFIARRRQARLRNGAALEQRDLERDPPVGQLRQRPVLESELRHRQHRREPRAVRLELRDRLPQPGGGWSVA